MSEAIQVLVTPDGAPLCIITHEMATAYPLLQVVTYRRQRGAAMNRGRSRQDVETPEEFILAVRRRFGSIVWDMAANSENSKGEHFVTAEEDALVIDWRERHGLRFCNPPFNACSRFAAKATETRESESPTLLLVPHSVGARWWQSHVHPFALVLSVGRIKFPGYGAGSMKDLALCVFGQGFSPGLEYWNWRSL